MCAFAVFESKPALDLDVLANEVGASVARSYHLADEDSVLGGLETWEVDLEFESLPSDL